MRRHRALCLAVVCWCVGSALQAKPAPPVKPAPKVEPQATLQICGPTNWGEFSQFGRQVTIAGNSSWTAAGEIRPDGKVQVKWACDGVERLANGLYVIQPDGSLVGHWGWESECEILGNGNLIGSISNETICREKVEPGPVQ